ncbi:TetR/AcrR family transcriptional regulator [Nocardia bovistercoris]|uniref:TetR/AcrR family transcriptional regulator n=1 Tax=Nocardia bovistercoris TaxID=2785916 RepID=A0A931ICE7_9NOCA|nr:TetR/AcrR family transcriptional regulator [Nocardia bovistercoris]
MVQRPIRTRAVPWHGTRAPEHPRSEIIDAASRCLVRLGLERTSIAAISREAGVSRQTVYNHFASREEIVDAAIERAATEASTRILARARGNETAAGFVVDLCMGAVEEFRRNPAISPMLSVLGDPGTRSRVLTPPVIAQAREFLRPLIDYLPERAPYLDEMTETYLRFELSLLTLDSDITRSPEALRGYLHRVLVPALGLPTDR